MRDTKPPRTLLSLSIVELMMAGVKTAIVHNSPPSGPLPCPAKGVPANQAAPPGGRDPPVVAEVWGWNVGESRRAGPRARGRPGPKCLQGSESAGYGPGGHRVVTVGTVGIRDLRCWTSAAELTAGRGPGIG